MRTVSTPIGRLIVEALPPVGRFNFTAKVKAASRRALYDLLIRAIWFGPTVDRFFAFCEPHIPRQAGYIGHRKIDEATCFKLGGQESMERSLPAAISGLAAFLRPAGVKHLKNVSREMLAAFAPLFDYFRKYATGGRRENLLNVSGKLVYGGSGFNIQSAFQLADPDEIVMLDARDGKLVAEILIQLKKMGAANLISSAQGNKYKITFTFRGRERKFVLYSNFDVKRADTPLPEEIAGFDVYLDLGACEFFYGTDGYNRILRAGKAGAFILTDCALRDYDSQTDRYLERQDPRINLPLEFQGAIFGKPDFGLHYNYLYVFRG